MKCSLLSLVGAAGARILCKGLLGYRYGSALFDPTHTHFDTRALIQGVKEEHVAKAVEECMRVVTLTQYADRTVQVTSLT